MDPIYETKFNHYQDENYPGQYQGDYQGEYQHNSTLTDIEVQLMIPILFFSSCLMPIYYCFKVCDVYKYCKTRIKTSSLTEVLIEDLSDDCSICLEKYRKNDKCIKLYCSHIFHKRCLNEWFKNRIDKSEELNCPLCRNNLF